MKAASTGKRPAPARSLKRSVAALAFLYAVAFAMAVLTGAKCQGDAPWRGDGQKPSSPRMRRIE